MATSGLESFSVLLEIFEKSKIHSTIRRGETVSLHASVANTGGKKKSAGGADGLEGFLKAGGFQENGV